MYKLFRLLIVLTYSCAVQPETQNSKPETKNDSNDYYENGNIRIEKKQLENGDSLWIFKQEDGGCWEENYYRNGEVYRKIVFNSNCIKSADYELKEGKRHGKWQSFHENGELREAGEYENGLLKYMFYKNEKGEHIQLEYGFIKDTFNFDLYYLKHDYNYIKNDLKSRRLTFTETENIEVAGNNEYHFPELKWNNNELYFDQLENNDFVKCLHGIIRDNTMPFFTNSKKIDFGSNVIHVSHVLRVSVPHETSSIYIYDLKTGLTYHFKFKNDKLSEIHFDKTMQKN